MRTFDTGKIIFEYPDSWEVEKADILSNPDCIATLLSLTNILICVSIEFVNKYSVSFSVNVIKNIPALQCNLFDVNLPSPRVINEIVSIKSLNLNKFV